MEHLLHPESFEKAGQGEQTADVARAFPVGQAPMQGTPVKGSCAVDLDEGCVVGEGGYDEDHDEDDKD